MEEKERRSPNRMDTVQIPAARVDFARFFTAGRRCPAFHTFLKRVWRPLVPLVTGMGPSSCDMSLAACMLLLTFESIRNGFAMQQFRFAFALLPEAASHSIVLHHSFCQRMLLLYLCQHGGLRKSLAKLCRDFHADSSLDPGLWAILPLHQFATQALGDSS